MSPPIETAALSLDSLLELAVLDRYERASHEGCTDFVFAGRQDYGGACMACFYDAVGPAFRRAVIERDQARARVLELEQALAALAEERAA